MNLIPHSSLFNFNDAFDNLYMSNWMNTPSEGFFSPRVDVRENDKSYTIIADLPGVEKKDLSVTLDHDMLTIEASTSHEHTEESDGQIVRRERHSGKYMRSFTLGINAKESDISASFKNGVLTLQVPKIKETAAASKKINIQ